MGHHGKWKKKIAKEKIDPVITSKQEFVAATTIIL